MKTKTLLRISMMAVLLTLCSWLSIPFAVPFTMQMFAAFCALLLLGGKNGTIAIALYIALGCAGLPVFSSFQGGIGHVLGPTGGYIVGLIGMGLLYWACEKCRKKYLVLLGGLLLCYALGTLWFCHVLPDRTAWAALCVCVFPYVLPDLAKLFLAKLVCGRIQRAMRG